MREVLQELRDYARKKRVQAVRQAEKDDPMGVGSYGGASPGMDPGGGAVSRSVANRAGNRSRAEIAIEQAAAKAGLRVE